MFSPSLKTNFKLGVFGEHSRVIARSERQRNSGGSIIKRNRYDNFGAYDLFSSERERRSQSASPFEASRLRFFLFMR